MVARSADTAERPDGREISGATDFAHSPASAEQMWERRQAIHSPRTGITQFEGVIDGKRCRLPVDKVVETVDSRVIAASTPAAMLVRPAVSRVSMERMADAPVPEVKVPELPATFDEGKRILLDVREQDEWDRGHAPEAKHLPLMDALRALEPSDGTLPGIDTDADVFVICHAGGRSMKVAQAMVGRGYQPRNVTGGMSSWAAAGRTVIDKDGKAGSV